MDRKDRLQNLEIHNYTEQLHSYEQLSSAKKRVQSAYSPIKSRAATRPPQTAIKVYQRERAAFWPSFRGSQTSAQPKRRSVSIVCEDLEPSPNHHNPFSQPHIKELYVPQPNLAQRSNAYEPLNPKKASLSQTRSSIKNYLPTDYTTPGAFNASCQSTAARSSKQRVEASPLRKGAFKLEEELNLRSKGNQVVS